MKNLKNKGRGRPLPDSEPKVIQSTLIQIIEVAPDTNKGKENDTTTNSLHQVHLQGAKDCQEKYQYVYQQKLGISL